MVEDLPLSRTVALVPEFAMKDLPLSKYSDDGDGDGNGDADADADDNDDP